MKLKDIATLANVSPSTVSLVMKNRSGVSAEKRKQIIKLLKDYGYDISSDSDAIAGGTPSAGIDKRTILFIKYKKHSMLVDGNPGFVNSIVDSVEKECRKQGYNLQMTVCNKERLSSVSDIVKMHSADGVLLLGTELDMEESAYLSNLSVPMVIIDTNLPRTDFNCVTMNNEEAIYHSVDYLMSLGHTNIGFIANALPSSNCSAREAGFKAALEHYGLAYDPKHIFLASPTPDGAYNSIRSLLEQGTVFPSALVANNDSIAIGAIKAFKEFNIRIPEDLSIIGFDGIPFSALSDPPLTTMEVSCLEIGIWAIRLLCDRIQYSFGSTTKMFISTKLLIRGSTAPYTPRETKTKAS